MAQLIAGFATSHTPILALVADEWEARAKNDRKNPLLWDTEGVHRSYDDIAERVGNRYADRAHPKVWNRNTTRRNATSTGSPPRSKRRRPTCS